MVDTTHSLTCTLHQVNLHSMNTVVCLCSCAPVRRCYVC
jgi:hypothetical protein